MFVEVISFQSQFTENDLILENGTLRLNTENYPFTRPGFFFTKSPQLFTPDLVTGFLI